MYEYRRLTPEQRVELAQERLVRGYPPHSPPHPVRDQTLYLLTGTCYEHVCHMRSANRRQQVLDALLKDFLMAGMELRAWSILPNHYHLLVDSVEMNVLGGVFQAIHGPTARYWNLEDGRVGQRFGFVTPIWRFAGNGTTTPRSTIFTSIPSNMAGSNHLTIG